MKEGAGERGCGKRLEHLLGVNLGWLVQDAEVVARKTPLQLLGLLMTLWFWVWASAELTLWRGSCIDRRMLRNSVSTSWFASQFWRLGEISHEVLTFWRSKQRWLAFCTLWVILYFQLFVWVWGVSSFPGHTRLNVCSSFSVRTGGLLLSKLTLGWTVLLWFSDVYPRRLISHACFFLLLYKAV